VKEDLTIRDMTDLMETMNGDHIIIANSRMTEAVITGLTEIAKTVPAMTIVTEDMAIAMEVIIITVREEGTTTTVREDTATTVLLTEITVLLMGIIIITVHTEIMIVSTIAPLIRKDMMTGL
jgi:hypothetical protein